MLWVTVATQVKNVHGARQSAYPQIPLEAQVLWTFIAIGQSDVMGDRFHVTPAPKLNGSPE